MINIDDIILYIKHNKELLYIAPVYKYIYDYIFHFAENNNIVVYLYLKQNKYGGEVTWSNILSIKLSDIRLYLRKEKLKKLKSCKV